MIAVAESGRKPRLVGDGGHALGEYQQHGEWMLDFWSYDLWEVLATLQRVALLRFTRFDRTGHMRPDLTAKELADEYNLGHRAPDPAYDTRCRHALITLGINPDELSKVIE